MQHICQGRAVGSVSADSAVHHHEEYKGEPSKTGAERQNGITQGIVSRHCWHSCCYWKTIKLSSLYHFSDFHAGHEFSDLAATVQAGVDNFAKTRPEKKAQFWNAGLAALSSLAPATFSIEKVISYANADSQQRMKMHGSFIHKSCHVWHVGNQKAPPFNQFF